MKAPPHRPELARKGYKRTLVLPSWQAAIAFLDDLLTELEANGRELNQATITALEIANRNYDRHREVQGDT